MSDTWSDLQALKNKQNTFRAKLLQRKKEREGLVAELQGETSSAPHVASSSASSALSSSTVQSIASPNSAFVEPIKVDPEIEKKLLLVLCDISLDIPSEASIIAEHTSRTLGRKVELSIIEVLLRKLAARSLISIVSKDGDGKNRLTVNSLDISKLEALLDEKSDQSSRKRGHDDDGDFEPQPFSKKAKNVDDIESLLSTQSAREREEKKVNEEIQQLLSAQLKEFCPYGVKDECLKFSQQTGTVCNKLHFKKIIQKHTDESLGDCSFLNTCFHMDTCKYVHYEIETGSANEATVLKKETGVSKKLPEAGMGDNSIHMFPPQWIQCDLRFFDMTTLGKCAVVMADPPWDIHMELPYGTMGDDEMRRLDIPALQDEGFIFLWVTGRAMELGRECLELWGYKRCDEIIWVKTNQLQRIIRTGRTGHWLNHGKEHCLVGVKGNPKGVNKGLDCDVIVAEVRATSHKPDEIYGIIERLSPGTRKVELFGRPHNVQPNWITLGNQLEGVCLKDPDIVRLFREKYPDGNCMEPPKNR
ncbi:hypothetical protein C0Q70_18814 [Pomacea canaliculata]|uniref:mRNA m(6)A methyltransferase n=1 Tax=Pomacea canaliculata TaxID=400727 RepID=A0A2T7NHM5_POMCA|nr:hypothetical protein C0Q70_18814 [Pomacea canaliculata]